MGRVVGVWVALLAGVGVFGAAWRRVLRDERRRQVTSRPEELYPPPPESFPEGPLPPEVLKEPERRTRYMKGSREVNR